MYTLTFALVAVVAVSANVAKLARIAQSCSPGEVTSDYCNSCTCIADGSGYVCTVNECTVQPARRTRRELIGRVCEPGHTKMEDCNSCFCIADGTGYTCTKKGCPKLPLTCQPNTTFMDYCNICPCPPDGLRENAVCTRVECPEGIWNEDGTLVNTGEPLNDPTPKIKRQSGDNESCVLGQTKMFACLTCRCAGNPPRWVCPNLGCI